MLQTPEAIRTDHIGLVERLIFVLTKWLVQPFQSHALFGPLFIDDPAEAPIPLQALKWILVDEGPGENVLCRSGPGHLNHAVTAGEYLAQLRFPLRRTDSRLRQVDPRKCSMEELAARLRQPVKVALEVFPGLAVLG